MNDETEQSKPESTEDTALHLVNIVFRQGTSIQCRMSKKTMKQISRDSENSQFQGQKKIGIYPAEPTFESATGIYSGSIVLSLQDLLYII